MKMSRPFFLLIHYVVRDCGSGSGSGSGSGADSGGGSGGRSGDDSEECEIRCFGAGPTLTAAYCGAENIDEMRAQLCCYRAAAGKEPGAQMRAKKRPAKSM